MLSGFCLHHNVQVPTFEGISRETEPGTTHASIVIDEAIQLRQMGPGKVTVLPTTSTGFNAALNAARSTLNEDAKNQVKMLLSKVETALQGIEGATTTALPKPTSTESPMKLVLRLLISPITLILGGETTPSADHNRMVADSGVGALHKPAPRGLIRAAEGRLLAEAARDVIDDEVSRDLSLPWESATVTR
ncbi:MAG: hypothetical protein ACI8TP_002778 [Acidimicrobiales bacterium]|jgi:hypothetical protein